MAKRNVLAFGGGLDSTGLLAIHLNREMACRYLGVSRASLDEALPAVDAVVFSDPGAEFRATYANIEVARQLCQDNGLRFEVVRHKKLTITQWLARNGTIPLVPGGPHTCSLTFKGEVMADWAGEAYPGEEVTWLIGIEADEGHRVKRFQAAKGTNSVFPLVTLGVNRERVAGIVEVLWPTEVRKSSCVFCPYMSEEEIIDTIRNTPEEWALAKQIEADFQGSSAAKHQAWLDAGSPLLATKTGKKRAPKGMWRLDSWAVGQRLFAKRVGPRGAKRMLSTDEWEARASTVEA